MYKWMWHAVVLEENTFRIASTTGNERKTPNNKHTKEADPNGRAV